MYSLHDSFHTGIMNMCCLVQAFFISKCFLITNNVLLCHIIAFLSTTRYNYEDQFNWVKLLL